MSSGLEITIYLVAAVIAAIAGTIVARAKRRDTGFWMVACLLLPPLILVLILLPKRRRVAAARKGPADDSLDADNLDNL
jgi:hypothetical protein